MASASVKSGAAFRCSWGVSRSAAGGLGACAARAGSKQEQGRAYGRYRNVESLHGSNLLNGEL